MNSVKMRFDIPSLRKLVLTQFGADPHQVEALLSYNDNHFQHDTMSRPVMLPLPDEESVLEWKAYARASETSSVWESLRANIPQLHFPVRPGMSQDPEYLQATRSGTPVQGMVAATGLATRQPGGLELRIHPTIAGHIPILIARDRADFESLLRAFLHRNEPREIPTSMGAAMIAGFNNWGRVAKLRAAFDAAHPEASASDWRDEFAWLIPQRHLYQDRFILVSDSPYSGVSETDRALSLIIRIEHESTHYMTKRLLGSMKNNLLDELIADYAGIVAAVGVFRVDWFLRFMGLEDFPRFREGGRFQNYLADPPLAPGCVDLLRAVLVQAAKNLAAFDASHSEELSSPRGRALMPLALSRLTLEVLASDHAGKTLEEALAEVSGDYQIGDQWRER